MEDAGGGAALIAGGVDRHGYRMEASLRPPVMWKMRGRLSPSRGAGSSGRIPRWGDGIDATE
jgi:hypothetical protein